MKKYWSAVTFLVLSVVSGGVYALGQEARDPAASRTFPSALGSAPAPTYAPPGPLQVGPSIGIEVPAKVLDDGIKNRDRELSVEVMNIVAKHGQTTDPSAQASLEKELSRPVEAQFLLRQEVRAKELKELEEQVKRLRAIHEQRAAEKDRIVQDRVRQLLRDSTGLGWGSDFAGEDSRSQFTPTRPRSSYSR
jgi:hypothetical protein